MSCTGDSASEHLCVICISPVEPAQAAMRCVGWEGMHHYCHAGCMEMWIGQCVASGQTPRCPTCQRAMQVRQDRLRNFLQHSRGGGDANSAYAEPSAAGGAELPSDEGWTCLDNIDWKKVCAVGGLAAAGGVALGLLAAGVALFMNKQQKGTRRSRR